MEKLPNVVSLIDLLPLPARLSRNHARCVQMIKSRVFPPVRSIYNFMSAEIFRIA